MSNQATVVRRRPDFCRTNHAAPQCGDAHGKTWNRQRPVHFCVSWLETAM